MSLTGPWILLARILFFSWRVLRRFLGNKGLLLAGSVAYNGLLSLIPLFAVVTALLSWFFDKATVHEVVRSQLDFIAAGYSVDLGREIDTILEQREMVQGLGIVVLFFFSSLAFRILEDAIAVIFHRSDEDLVSVLQIQKMFKRDFWVSAALPFAFIATIGASLILITILVTVVETFSNQFFTRLGLEGEHTAIWWAGIRLLYFAGQVLLFASIYKLMPVLHVGYQRALIGGFSAGLLWELTRRILAWYFTNISMASHIYGSFTTTVVILVTLEVAAVIVLLGAQVIAELEWSEEAGIPWYEGADEAILGASRRILGRELKITQESGQE